MQAQDFVAAKWALALRVPSATEAAVERAFNEGKILRTHVLRPTWHFVSPTDIRWMILLTAPRIRQNRIYCERKLELDESLFKRSRAALTKALRGNNPLPRKELRTVLDRARVENRGDERLAHILMRLELEGLICSGPRQGKQFTYMLLDEAQAKYKTHAKLSAEDFDRDTALAELSRRYLTSRGPATAQDFAWWSGLTIGEAKSGFEMVRAEFRVESVEGKTYWFPDWANILSSRASNPVVHLLPVYDELVSGYRDRSAMFRVLHAKRFKLQEKEIFLNLITLNGEIVGSWRKVLEKKNVKILVKQFVPLLACDEQAIQREVERYGHFAGLPVVRE